MGITEKIRLREQERRLDAIDLEHILFVLDCSIADSGANAIDILIKLIGNGLHLSYPQLGYNFSDLNDVQLTSEVLIALTKIKNGCSTISNETVQTQGRFNRPIGQLSIKRSELKKIYSEYGEAQYPWPLIPKPQSINDWRWFPIDAKSEGNVLDVKLKSPLDKLDKEMQDARIIADGAPTLSLRNFIEHLLVEATGTSPPLSTFYSLVEEYGLVVYDKVMEGQAVSPSELLVSLRQREQQADKSFDEDGFQFWETLTKESKYSVFRDDVAMAYEVAGKSRFPWLNLYNKSVWLNVNEYAKIDTSYGFGLPTPAEFGGIETPKSVTGAIRNDGEGSQAEGEIETEEAKLPLIVKPTDVDPDETLAALFDPVPVEALAQMFPADKQDSIGIWRNWAERASRNGLKESRQGRAKFNPYKAGKWLVLKGNRDWDIARLNRVLKRNLPARSLDDAYMITGEID